MPSCVAVENLRAPTAADATAQRYVQESAIEAAEAQFGPGRVPLSPSSVDTVRDVFRPLPIAENQESNFSRWDDMLQRPRPNDYGPSSAQDDSRFALSFGLAIPTTALTARLPPTECCDYLVSKYFSHCSPLFKVIHGPTFQDQYITFQRDQNGASLSWLAVLFVVCSMGLNTIEANDPVIVEWLSKQQNNYDQDTLALSRSLRSAALSCLAQDQFLIHHDLNTLEAVLLLIYSICHMEGVERGWTLLGMALNMGIALRCNKYVQRPADDEQLRRRQCWAGLLMLHTYQGLLFRDVDISVLLNIEARAPNEAPNVEDRADPIMASHSPQNLGLMEYKIRLFRLSTQLCSHISKFKSIYSSCLEQIEQQVIFEQGCWDRSLLVNGSPGILDTANYAHWCILQTYAHQLYLLIHRPFHRSSSPHFRPQSRDACLKSSRALLNLHDEFCNLPRLRNYRWLVYGMTSFNALQGAIALASCLVDSSADVNISDAREALDAMAVRMGLLRERSPVCKRVYGIVCQLQ
ncbi:unnamed protein product [Alternaria alternata]